MKLLSTNLHNRGGGLREIHGYLALGALLVVLLGTTFYLLAAGADNPRADFWREVRQGASGYTASSSEGHSVLIQNGGENWREVRNLLLVKYSPWLMGGVLAAIIVFHLIKGGDKLERPRSGIMIERYNLFERLLHWYTALLFVLLAITGLSILLGRAGLLPLVGHGPFASYLAYSKIVHNWSGPLFLIGVLVEFLVWLGDNYIHKLDFIWFKNMGGMVGDSPRPHAEKNNGGQKAWFWLIAFFGLGVGITGILLDFPIWGQDRQTMQLSLFVHATVAVLFVTASFGHIYMGTAGSEGAIQGMLGGKVDASWAMQHCDLWYRKKAAQDPRFDPEDSKEVV